MSADGHVSPRDAIKRWLHYSQSTSLQTQPHPLHPDEQTRGAYIAHTSHFPNTREHPMRRQRTENRRKKPPESMLSQASFEAFKPRKQHYMIPQREQGGLNKRPPIEIASVSSEMADSSPMRPLMAPPRMSFERRPRRKTKEDRYVPKSGREYRETRQIQPGSKPKPKRRKVQKSGTALLNDFEASNIAQERLTVNRIEIQSCEPQINLEFLARERLPRLSKEVLGAQVPDLAFSELDFLNKRREKPPSKGEVPPWEAGRKKHKAAVVDSEISRFFSDRNAAPTRDSKSLANIHPPSVPLGAENLPGRPFLGFGSAGPNSSSPVKVVAEPSRVQMGSPPRRGARSPTRTTSYYTWTQSNGSCDVPQRASNGSVLENVNVRNHQLEASLSHASPHRTLLVGTSEHLKHRDRSQATTKAERLQGQSPRIVVDAESTTKKGTSYQRPEDENRVMRGQTRAQHEIRGPMPAYRDAAQQTDIDPPPCEQQHNLDNHSLHQNEASQLSANMNLHRPTSSQSKNASAEDVDTLLRDCEDPYLEGCSRAQRLRDNNLIGADCHQLNRQEPTLQDNNTVASNLGTRSILSRDSEHSRADTACTRRDRIDHSASSARFTASAPAIKDSNSVHLDQPLSTLASSLRASESASDRLLSSREGSRGYTSRNTTDIFRRQQFQPETPRSLSSGVVINRGNRRHVGEHWTMMDVVPNMWARQVASNKHQTETRLLERSEAAPYPSNLLAVPTSVTRDSNISHILNANEGHIDTEKPYLPRSIGEDAATIDEQLPWSDPASHLRRPPTPESTAYGGNRLATPTSQTRYVSSPSYRSFKGVAEDDSSPNSEMQSFWAPNKLY